MPEKPRRSRIRWILSGGAIALLFLSLAVPADIGAGARADGAAAYGRGDYAGAVDAWSRNLSNARAQNDPGQVIELLLRRAEAYQRLGFLSRAEADLREALAQLPRTGHDPQRAELLNALGVVHLMSGQNDAARSALGEALGDALRRNDSGQEARILGDITHYLELEGRHGEALWLFGEVSRLLESAGSPRLQWSARLNRARLHIHNGNFEAARPELEAAGSLLEREAPDAEMANGLITLGALVVRGQNGLGAGIRVDAAMAYRSLRRGLEIAEELGNDRLASFALGYLGQLYELENRLPEARRLTRRSLFLAQQAGAPEALYLWQWQLGRMMRKAGDIDGAITAHRDAIDTLSTLRTDMIAGFGRGQSIFNDSVRPLILGAADLLLIKAAGETTAQGAQATLAMARDTVELLKAAELEDYFHDDCLAALQRRARGIDVLPPATAALYPVVLPDRTELILSIDRRLERLTVNVGEEALGEWIDRLAAALRDPASKDYREPARQLYDWLVAPVRVRLTAAGIDTLVVIPSGSLATIPFAALHDGKGFLVEQLNLAVAPGLTLIDPKPWQGQTANALVGGLSRGVAGFPALPHVPMELRDIDASYSTRILRDDAFLWTRLESALVEEPFNIVHLATHAEFRSEADKSFLLAYDGPLTMAGLEGLVKHSRFRAQPVELLTLSACSTAQGDARAALGLAGVGIKAGARSVLATLWVINDESTARLVGEFYNTLATGGGNKAAALRKAQMSLIESERYRHPFHWAPFLLIGNWL